MQRRHARYPFLADAREAVGAADVDLAELVTSDDPAVERGLGRVERAIGEGTVGPSHRQPRTELLSYPVARVLISLVDQDALTRRYAEAEARTAIERLREDDEDEELRSTDRGRVALTDLLREFDLAAAIRERESGYELAVTDYLLLATGLEGDQWRLVNRALADGSVPISRSELFALLEMAIERRVREGLPFQVPHTVASELEAERARVRELLADLDLTREIDTVAPDQFPPCVAALVERAQGGENLPYHSRFALTAFLATIGMSVDDIVELFAANQALDEETTRYQYAHVRGDRGPAEYAPPSCSTMQAYGDCVNRDELCATIAHPLAYYERALERGDEEGGQERADS